MGSEFALLVLVVGLALAFDYVNGFHDTANAVATVVSTGVLPGRTAVLLAAACNFAGAFVGVGVAKTIGGDIVTDPKSITQTVVAAALIGAIGWNLFTWYYGIPSSSSHALVGGLIGAAWCHLVVEGGDPAGTLADLFNSKGVLLTLKALVVSPLAGFTCGLMMMVALLWATHKIRPTPVNAVFRRLQLVSASFMAFAHGSNDAQKAMGIVTLALATYTASRTGEAPGKLEVPAWVIVACATAMAAGTASGGWRIMKTMGHKIIKLRPIHGFAAETAAAGVILMASYLHAPVSTTHVISSSIMGVGASRRVSAVRWGVAGNMLTAWVLTIPVSALSAALVYRVLHAIWG